MWCDDFYIKHNWQCHKTFGSWDSSSLSWNIICKKVIMLVLMNVELGRWLPFCLLWFVVLRSKFVLQFLPIMKIYCCLSSQVPADILPRETFVWKLQMLESASAYANSRLHNIKAQTLILCRSVHFGIPFISVIM